MRIVNTGYSPRYLSYGDTTTGGKTLDPGQESKELPLSYVHSTNLWKDIDKGICQIRLNEEDKAFMAKIMDAANKPITMVQPPAPPAPPPPPPPKPEPPPLIPILNDPVPEAPITPGEKAVQDMMKGYKYAEIRPGAKSLKDLQAENKVANQAHVPHPGMPSFVGVGQKASLSDISKHMGSRL